MKQKLLTILIIVFMGGVANVALAQSYLDIPPDPEFSKDYLNRIIYGDTTETGERVAADRVYRLQPGAIYYYNNPIVTDGWDLKIVARDTSADFKKAIILTARNDQGKVPPRFAEVHGDILFKNIYFSGVTDNDKQVREFSSCYKDSALIEMESCYVEWPKQFGFCRVYSAYTTVHVKDSYVKNISSTGGPFVGKLIQFQNNPVNEVIFQNNTFINFQGPVFSVRFNTVGNIKIDHNTFVNTLKWPFHYEYWTNAEITNNIFYNSSAYGENEADASNQDQEGLQFGIINMYPVPDSMLTGVGLADSSERKMVVRNNLYYFDQAVQDYIAKWWTEDSVKIEPWMNERTKAMFDNDAAYPYLDAEDPLLEDPVFVECPTADSMIKKMDQWRTDGKKTTWWWVDDDGNKIGNETDRPHDLSYPMDSPAYTAADGGFPLGDLNWFPDKKAEWITGIGEDREVIRPSEYTLDQNYPNPFNPTTTIRYYIPKTGKVNISLYNVLGQRVKVLVDGNVAAGEHSVELKAGNLASGVYIYRMEAGNFTSYKKMILMK